MNKDIRQTLTAERPECSDGLDNNGNTLFDYPDDESCFAAGDPFEELREGQ